jgi:DNA repair protein RadA/Sms
MGKTRPVLECRACGHRVAQWAGRCPRCGEWETIGEASPASTSRPGAEATPLILGKEEPERRLTTGFEGFDRVLGGGLVPGSVVLLAGEPGVGKSTLLLQLVAALASRGSACLYASGEESRGQVAGRAGRLGLPPDAVSFVPGRELPDVVEGARMVAPVALVVDSIQSIRDPASSSLPGGTAQVRACADALVGLAKEEGVVVILAGQVTKDGDLAGPRTLEHAVDVVCSFEGDPRTGLRILAGGKNRFGAEGEVTWFEMGPRGLQEVEATSILASSEGEPGAATALVAAGRRALAVEIQALTSETDGPPRRHVSGLDPRRFGLVAAVVDRALGLRLARSELYGAAAGGLRVDDPGTDLAVAAALASAARGVAPPPGSAFVGEVGLTGSLRPGPNPGARMAAAAAAGIRTVFCAGDAEPPDGVRIVRVRRLEEALRWVGRRDQGRTGRPAADRRTRSEAPSTVGRRVALPSPT